MHHHVQHLLGAWIAPRDQPDWPHEGLSISAVHALRWVDNASREDAPHAVDGEEAALVAPHRLPFISGIRDLLVNLCRAVRGVDHYVFILNPKLLNLGMQLLPCSELSVVREARCSGHSE